MDENLKALKETLKRLNRAYSDLVAYSIITIHIYEEYLLGKASSQELAIAMTDLLKALPKDFAGSLIKKPRKGPESLPKGTYKTKGPIDPPSKIDGKGGINLN